MAMKEDRKGNIVIFGKNAKRKLFLMGFSMIAIFIAVLMSTQFFIKSSKKAKEENTSPEKTAKLIAITIGASVIGGLIGGFYLSRKAEDVTITISGDASSAYGSVIGLMAMLKEAGFSKVGLKTDAKRK